MIFKQTERQANSTVLTGFPGMGCFDASPASAGLRNSIRHRLEKMHVNWRQHDLHI
jgi:hypothetical protein